MTRASPWASVAREGDACGSMGPCRRESQDASSALWPRSLDEEAAPEQEGQGSPTATQHKRQPGATRGPGTPGCLCHPEAEGTQPGDEGGRGGGRWAPYCQEHVSGFPVQTAFWATVLCGQREGAAVT